ncbi:metallopeptidase TldD-related protein [Tenggerimyces flavus]|uniref:Metallopeptidase TldD-related protein n=1 Tax=Tenggerimyces flavus TaxID=1708749 RepID=A0ABV7YE38_9ACTN|nr:metallopeptidase TldD-related protein [Tenggerimyces flavus]MBM7788073.1 putative Zn-dependent protease [Tenggerimyces flavus]
MSPAVKEILTLQETVERSLALSKADGCVVIAEESSNANLRWANNTLTTNGVSLSRKLTVIAVVNGQTGVSSGVVSRSSVDLDELESFVRAAEEIARNSDDAPDARPLVEGPTSVDWSDPPVETSIRVFDSFAPALGETFGMARTEGTFLYGFVEHDVTTTYLGSSTGLRLRHVQPTGYVTWTGKSNDRARSAWVGQATRNFTDVDVLGLNDELRKRLRWSARRIDLEAGRYETIMPPAAVADLLIYTYWRSSARDAQEGQSVFSKPGGGTRVGERLSSTQLSMRSDPRQPGLECAPFVVAHRSTSAQSTFDNGLPLGRVDWIRDGSLAALATTRHSADLTGLETTPFVDNLILEVPGATGTTAEQVARTERGLLLTCLWYIREVDPQTLLMTGLTRDGIYLVERGEVVGEVNNFRFNESPVDLLSRFTEAGATVPAFSREWGDYFPRVAAPTLRIPDFNMSSVSQAS